MIRAPEAWQRNINNYPEMRDIVQDIFPNSTITDFPSSSLSALETALLFTQADMVIGPHGAGWTNIIWSRVGVQCVEIISADFTNLMYQHWAHSLGLRHNYFTSSDAKVDLDLWRREMRRIRDQTREERRKEIREDIERRKRFDHTCVTKLEEEMMKQGKHIHKIRIVEENAAASTAESSPPPPPPPPPPPSPSPPSSWSDHKGPVAVGIETDPPIRIEVRSSPNTNDLPDALQ